jgi:hypothetical protein
VPAVAITLGDLSIFAPDLDPAKGQAMIEDALAMAAQVAPCITESDFEHPGAAKAVIRGAILRWHEAGSGAVTQTTSGPFSQTVDSRAFRRGLFTPTELESLRKLCAGANEGAFSLDTVSLNGLGHLDVCALNFGAVYCSCGAALTGLLPLFELNES